MVRILTATAAIALVGSIGISASAANAAGNAANGADLFNRCAVCHSVTKGGGNRIGPNLFGIVGSKAGTYPGYSFSPAMQKSGIVWTEAMLTNYLVSPSTVVPGNKMPFAGFEKPQQAADVAAYLATLK
jgi:cytochrome c